MNPTPVEVLCLRPEADFARVDALPPPSLQVRYCGPADAEVPAHLKTAKGLVIPAVGPKLPASLFENSALKLVQVTGAGVDRVDPQAVKANKIPLANVPGGSNSAVAEYVMTSASLLLRRLAWADAEIKAGRYTEWRTRMLAANLAGIEDALVGIIGLGVIGLAVARLAVRSGARLCYYDPATPHAAAATEIGARSMSLGELLSSADVVSVHVPLMPATTGLIGARELARMKPTAVLIQASRGGVIDEAALAAALQSAALAGAAVDVYSAEPPPPDNPLFALTGDARNRILFTPHIGGVTRQASTFLFRTAWQNVERVLVFGEPPLYRVY
ncbi:MAG TPA: NAD(P)-dependent oxidoreductase [Xanthobacteraceae bacterium]|jgi:phosphoglycerate dehydrogenase-like enzyme|nr:NAD(P)-dependent oxidoreductase [Xanthobacteraceae bacterium]